MAVTVTPVLAGKTKYICDIEATADADTDTGNVPHGLGAIPLEVSVAPLQQVAAGLSLWAVSTIDAVNIVVTKSVAAGSGVAGNQVRVTVSLPHSLTQ